ncbi:MAG: hypothetical protein JAY74_18735 [Candidatus Thiodiazotropha taylori]|nr:hypothetical protein [Candidatus Thiodiazotropha taylori]
MDKWEWKKSESEHYLEELNTSIDTVEIGVRNNKSTKIVGRNYILSSDIARELLGQFALKVETGQEIPGALMRYIAWGARRASNDEKNPWMMKTGNRSVRLEVSDLIKIAVASKISKKERSRQIKMLAAEYCCDEKTIKNIYKQENEELLQFLADDE